MARAASIGTPIVERIAARGGVDSQTLETTLYDVVDADALEAATNDTGDRRPPADLRIEFIYDGHHVVVKVAGVVTIR